jgi:hypothetical protein
MPRTGPAHVSPSHMSRTPADGNCRSVQEARLYFTESHFPGSVTKLLCKENKAVSKGYIASSVTRRGQQREKRGPDSSFNLSAREEARADCIKHSGMTIISESGGGYSTSAGRTADLASGGSSSLE